MSARFFFDNQTLNDYYLYNNDKYCYSLITYKISYYSIELPFNTTNPLDPTTFRIFTLVNKKDKNHKIEFTIDANGIIYSYKFIGNNPDNVKAVITTNKVIYIPFTIDRGSNTETNNVPIVKNVSNINDNTIVLYVGSKYVKTFSN